MPLEGRGKYYGRVRGLADWLLTRVYRDGWAPRLLERSGLGADVRVVEEHVAVDDARWPNDAPPLRLAFASDLHAGPTTAPALIARAVERLRAIAPDVLLLGGDYVFLDARHVGRAIDALATVDAPLGRFAVMGNHDLWADDARIHRCLRDAGFRVLVNEAAHLPPPFEHVSICGLDDPWTGIREPAPAFADARDVRVVLVHSPRALEIVGGARFDVMVCGHTHGGHVALPGGIPIVHVGQRRYAHGRHDVGGGRTLVVSRGIGGIELPLRVFADPDVLSVVISSRSSFATSRASSSRDAATPSSSPRRTPSIPSPPTSGGSSPPSSAR